MILRRIFTTIPTIFQQIADLEEQYASLVKESEHLRNQLQLQQSQAKEKDDTIQVLNKQVMDLKRENERMKLVNGNSTKDEILMKLLTKIDSLEASLQVKIIG